MLKTAHVALYDSLADWEPGHLLAELRTGRFTGTPVEVVAVAETLDPITTMGGVRMRPDVALAELDPAGSSLLILPGADFWDAEPAVGEPWVAAARRLLAAGVPVAAICGATAGLARGGLLDGRRHTSADPGYLAATGYAGADGYVADARAVTDDGLTTAGPQSPAHFAAETLRALGLVDAELAGNYAGVFADGDPAAFHRLMAAAA